MWSNSPLTSSTHRCKTRKTRRTRQTMSQIMRWWWADRDKEKQPHLTRYACYRTMVTQCVHQQCQSSKQRQTEKHQCEYTVTPKTLSMFASNTVCEVWCNQGWESRFTLVELKIVFTPGYSPVPGSCDLAQWPWRYGQFEISIPLKGFFHFWIEARISVKEMDHGYCVTVQTKIHK